jgi:hypothetical protein
VEQIITEISEAVSEKDNIMVITKMVLNLMKQKVCCSHRHISTPLKDSLIQNITFIGLTASREEKAFPITM